MGQSQNVRGSNQRPSMKKEATPNARGSNRRPLMKKDATPKLKGLKSKTSDEGDFTNQKS
jgi:hypothetical protein